MPAESPIEIVYESTNYCIVNKPSGYVVHKTAGAESAPVLLQTLRDQIGKKVYPVHRLDRSTSGCLLMAFDSKTTAKLQQTLSLDMSLKKYLLLCRGHLNSSQGIFDRPLSDENKVKKEARTDYRLIQKFKEFSLVEATLRTGRKHQIRRHFEFEKHHIVGDVNYGKGWLNREFREKFGLQRIFLHCTDLSFECPISQKRAEAHAPLPMELQSILEQL